MIRPTGVAIALLMLASACATSAPHGARYDVEWFEDAQAVPAARAAIEQLLSEPWLDAIEVEIEAAGAARTPTALASCTDYLAVADRRPRPTHGGTTLVIFQDRALHCHAVGLTLAAQPATTSHLRTLAFDEGLPDRLPWQASMIISSAEEQRIADERPHASWREVLGAPLTGFSSCGTHCGVYAEPGQTQTVRLLARGDFDGDGIEDVLITSFGAVIGGSYQTVRMFVLTRRQADGAIELIRMLDY